MGNSNDETNFPHKLLVANKQVSKMSKAYTNVSSANIKLIYIILADLLVAIPQVMFSNRSRSIKKRSKKDVTLLKNATTESAEKATKCYFHQEINERNKKT